jgi:pyruvate ferredoxin oxidoreductase alpha subunit
VTQRLSANLATAWGARLARVDVIPSCSITPSPEIIETLARWVDHGDMPGRLLASASESAALNTAATAACEGKRVFTASSTQGLLHAMQMLYRNVDWRVPLVFVNIAQQSPATTVVEPDYHDILTACISGFVQIHCATAQEMLDGVLLAYRLAEHEQVRLPVWVNQDVYASAVADEPVSVPNAITARQFVGSYDPDKHATQLHSTSHQTNTLLTEAGYASFRFDMYLAAQRALAIYDEVVDEFADFFGRRYPAIDSYRSDDADYVFVMTGAFATRAKAAIDRLRESGWKVGLLRPRLLLPLAHERFAQLLAGKQAVAVIDQHFAMGNRGVLHTQLTAALFGRDDVPAIFASFIGGIGGRELTIQEFFEMASMLRKAVLTGVTPPPQLLFSESELSARPSRQHRILTKS